VKTTLIHPPLDDPTLPYHSTAYLKGHLSHNGFKDVITRDLNVEFVDYCLDPDVVQSFSDEIEARVRGFERQRSLTFQQQEELYTVWATERLDPSAARRAAEVLRSCDAFTDYDLYQRSVEQIRRHFHLLGTLCYPADIQDFKIRSRGRYSVYHLNDLFNAELCGKVCYPIERFFFDRCIDDADMRSSECIGMSVVYDHQLLPALHLMRLIRRRYPEKTLLLGGTAISQCYKYLKDKASLKRFFELCDGIVVGEGETAICEIADADGELTKKKIPNLIRYDAASDSLHLPQCIHYENVAALGSPIYEYQWDLYLAPERGINYSPTRGCYWNRCTFCDYGLNTDKPTSPWRERSVEVVIDDLRKVCREARVKYVYFAVDVMAPGYLERLSDAILQSDLNIRWSAELRMEKIFSSERCRKLAESGCVSVSFGMESGNQRVLDLIDKGTKVQYMGETMKNFAGAGIAVQIMAFSHFPTETEAERNETKKFVQLHQEDWSAGGIGKFVLTGTALVAKNPEKFGVSLIEPKNMDIVRVLGHQSNADGKQQIVSAEEGDASFDETGGLFPSLYPRPWAGGTDSLHSMIYYGKYGRNFFKQKSGELKQMPAPRGSDPIEDCRLTINGKLAMTDFDIVKIYMTRAELKCHIEDLRKSAVEPTYQDFQKWQAEVPGVSSERRSYWIVRHDKRMRIPELVYDALTRAAKSGTIVRELVALVEPQFREMLLERLRSLQRKNYIALNLASASRANMEPQAH
jgi:anaerobic magnesium-protoporphyrin IX monomethyl ester cyclase